MKFLWDMTRLTLLVALMGSSADAFEFGHLFGGKPAAGSCESKFKTSVPAASEQDLISQADALKMNHRYCEAIEYYKQLMVLADSADSKTRYWIGLIESALYQYDYETFFDQTQLFLQDRSGSSQQEYVHYLVLKAVAELMRNVKSMTNPWVQYALGASSEQADSSSPKNYYKMRVFLEKYPNSKWRSEVMSWLEEAKSNFNGDYANELRLLVAKREYVPAISRFHFLLGQGVANPDFTQLIYECLLTMSEFSYHLTDEKVVPSSKLARWLSVPESQITLQLRLQTQASVDQEMQKLLGQLIQNFPTDPWTIKAKSDFGFR